MRITIATLHVRDSAQAVPLAAGCLKSCLPEHERRSTHLVDLYCDQLDENSAEQLLHGQPDLIAFPVYSWNRLPVLELCRHIKSRKKDIVLVAGGPEASADGCRLLEESTLDAVICGEGEQAFATLIKQVAKKSVLDNIAGLTTRSSESAQPNAAVCSDLDRLPSPWLDNSIELARGCGVLWEVARGCHFNCAFCFDAKGYQGVRPLPFERLRNELNLFARKQVSQIWVLDSTFNAPPGRGKKLLQLIREVAPQLHYHIEAKADLLDDEIIAQLSELSCSVQIGLQSADPTVLIPLHRQLDRKRMRQQLQKLSDAGVTFGLDLIYGLPGDNHAGFSKSLDFALANQPNQVDIFPLAVLPGTELFTQKEKLGLDADRQPPYLIKQSRSYSLTDMADSQRLAAATDIFYNRGRAVGFFLQLCQAVSLKPATLLGEFFLWLKDENNISEDKVLQTDSWQVADILRHQLDFARFLLNKAKRSKLIPYAEDLIRYHFCCAEMILTEDCHPQPERAIKAILRERWTCNPHCLIESFHCPVDELEMYGGEPLKTMAAQVSQSPNWTIFLKQNDEMIIELLDDAFAEMLIKARSGAKGNELIKGLEHHSGHEMLNFAVSQGLLIPAT